MIKEIQKTREYLDYLERHYNNVQTAWEMLQDKCKDMPFVYDDFKFGVLNEMVKNHDVSKLSNQEFIAYRQKFFPVEGEEVNVKSFELAWENHQKENDHHWQNWTMRKFNNPIERYLAVVHNVIDWVAMGIEFNDTALSYYDSNKNNIIIPKEDESFIYDILHKVYSN